jgi:hypothetical protein
MNNPGDLLEIGLTRVPNLAGAIEQVAGCLPEGKGTEQRLGSLEDNNIRALFKILYRLWEPLAKLLGADINRHFCSSKRNPEIFLRSP